MKLLRLSFFKPLGSALLWAILLCLMLSTSPALALTPGDPILVNNRNLVGPKAVAEYYAQKCQVPWHNLLGVAVTTAEEMTRQEYEHNTFILNPKNQGFDSL